MSNTRVATIASGLLLLAAFATLRQAEPVTAAEPEASPQTSEEARATERSDAPLAAARIQARVLHETIHGTLQVVHRDFFREDESLHIPSKSFEDVFAELEKSHKVQLSWIAVNAQPMSVDNRPEGEFEEQAAKALADGKPEFEIVDGKMYQFAGAIRLSNTCLGCHLPRRSSNDDRVAGLVIRFPLR